MKDFFISPDFKRYRKKQLEVIVDFIRNRFYDNNVDFAYLKGAIEMGRRIVNIPGDASNDAETKTILASEINNDLDKIAIEMLREKDPTFMKIPPEMQFE